MPRYFRISDSKNTIYVAIDESGAVIIKDSAGKKVFLSRYQARLMKFGIENLVGTNSDRSNGEIEEITKEVFDRVGKNGE